MALSFENVVLMDKASDLLPRMSERDRTFVASVLGSVGRYKSMSEKQAACIQNAIDRVLNPQPVKTETVGEMSGLIALFDKAKEKLKFPSIVLKTESGQKVEVAMASARAKVPGSINVTDGGPWGSNRWFGRVLRDGTWEQPRSPVGDIAGVRSLLRDLALNPAETAAKYGKLTGHCCFCNRGLDDDRSLSVGYGPVCAKNFGLEWGVKAMRKAETEAVVKKSTRALAL